MDNYVPLTLKYRPQTLDDVVGQKITVQMLKNAVSLNRINHVYLFRGPAGTGKTSIARIWSKMLNCKSEYAPCCECSICKSIADGKNLDVLEMNSADKRRIEDMREVLSKLRFKPTLKYKIVILDEVHMLTNEAWNALLKDLEEPPEYCIFILCTTNPEKIPVTVLSRCMEFGFTSVTDEDVEERLEFICDEEGYIYETDALEMIAKKAKGGMRDALSDLEKIATFSSDEITADNVRNLLDIIDPKTFVMLIDYLYELDIDSAISIIDELVSKNKSLDMIYYQLQDEYGSMVKNYFHKRSEIKYNKNELLYICKLFVDYEQKMRFANDKYYVVISLLYDIINRNSDDLLLRISELENAIAKGGIVANSGKTNEDRIKRIKKALSVKRDQNRADNFKRKMSESDTQETEEDKTEDNEFLSSFLNMSKAKKVGD